MWEKLMARLPNSTVLINAFLSAAIPGIVYVINRALHRYGDPPWKKGEGE